jgi:peptide/nickel transport system substrate-binding protein
MGLAIVVAAGLALAACSSDDKGSSTTQAATTTATGASATTAGGSATTAGGGAAAGTAPSAASAPAPAGSSPAGSTPTPQGGKVVVGIGSEPETLDVDRTRAGTDQYVLQNIFEQLVTHDANGKLVPSLASSWTMTPDGLTYDFKLRDGATFQDGSPVTPEDVAFSYTRYADPALGNVFAYQVAGVQSVTAKSPTEVEIVLKAPDGAFLSSGGYASIVPKAYIDKVGNDEFGKNPIGTGPWKFVSREIGSSVDLTRYDGYWGNKPGYSDLQFRIIPDDNSRVSALRSGEIDAAAQIPPQSVKALEDDNSLKTVSQLTGDNIFLIFNTKAPDAPWDKPEVRQALAMAIDQEAIQSSVLGGLATLMSGVSPLNVGWDPKNVKQQAYDPDGAKKMLADAGYPDGFNIELWGPVNGRLPNSEQYLQAVAGFWEDIGVKVDLHLVAYSQYVDSERAASTINGVVMGLYGDSLTFDPQARLVGTMTCAGPYSHVCDQALDAQIDKVKTTVDPDARVQAYEQAFEMTNAQTYAIWSYTSQGTFAMKKTVDWKPYFGIPYTKMFQIAPAA